MNDLLPAEFGDDGSWDNSRPTVFRLHHSDGLSLGQDVNCKMRLDPNPRQPPVQCGRMMIVVGHTIRQNLPLYACPHCDRGIKR